MKIYGTCNHHDFAGVGIAMPDNLQEWRIRKLQEMGSNAWRCSHSMPSPEFLEACDRLGPHCSIRLTGEWPRLRQNHYLESLFAVKRLNTVRVGKKFQLFSLMRPLITLFCLSLFVSSIPLIAAPADHPVPAI